MAATILIIDYLPGSAQRAAPVGDWHAAAEQIGALDGLRWKYWLRSRENDTFGGVYLFDTQRQATMAGDQLEKSLAEAGAQTINLRFFDVDVELSALTRGFVG